MGAGQSEPLLVSGARRHAHARSPAIGHGAQIAEYNEERLCQRVALFTLWVSLMTALLTGALVRCLSAPAAISPWSAPAKLCAALELAFAGVFVGGLLLGRRRLVPLDLFAAHERVSRPQLQLCNCAPDRPAARPQLYAARRRFDLSIRKHGDVSVVFQLGQAPVDLCSVCLAAARLIVQFGGCRHRVCEACHWGIQRAHLPRQCPYCRAPYNHVVCTETSDERRARERESDDSPVGTRAPQAGAAQAGGVVPPLR